MNVKELIERLKEEDEELEVILSSDAGGNNYSPLSDVAFGNYEPDTTYNGEFTAEGYNEIYVEDEEEYSETNAVVLYPTI